MNLVARSISSLLNSLSKKRDFNVFRAFQVELDLRLQKGRDYTSYKSVGKTSTTMSIRTITNEEASIDLCKQIFSKGVEAVHPRNLIRNQILRDGSTLVIKGTHRVQLDKFSRVFVVGFGKAVLPMAEELLELLGSNLHKCVLSVPTGTRKPIDSRIEVHQGARNNIPDDNAFQAAKRIVELTSACSPTDLLFVIISGGGSALLPFPNPPITLSEKGDLVKLLSRRGADIQELNTVRRKISQVKGGGLLKTTNAGKVLSLILSDVLGDDLDIIASGPTTLPHPAGKNALSPIQVIQKYVPSSTLVPSHIVKMLEAEEEPTLNNSNNQSERVSNIILGSNKLALDAAGKCAMTSRYVPVILTSLLEGEATLIGTTIAQLCDLTLRTMKKGKESMADFENMATPLFKKLNLGESKVNELVLGIYQVVNDPKTHGLCLLFGGETTVKVTGNGIGGRNQELALSAAITLQEHSSEANIILCSGGTDGIDGPCDAAGALVTPSTVTAAKDMGLCATQFLKNNDSYNFFKHVRNGKYHLVTGHTETNVMDMVICILPRTRLERAPSASALPNASL